MKFSYAASARSLAAIVSLVSIFSSARAGNTLLAASPIKSPALLGFDAGDHEPIVRLQNSDPIAGITSAGSTFIDVAIDGRSKGSVVNTVGSASLVRIKSTGKIVALTASHVVAGENPWLELYGKHVATKKVLVDNDRDLAILELPAAFAHDRKLEPALTFENDGLHVAPLFMKRIDEGKIPTVILAYYWPGHALGFAIRPWVNPGTETARQRAIVHAPVVSRNYNEEQVRVFTKVTSGASGSAVLDLREQRVAGLVAQSHYYLSETYLASPEVLKKHFEIYNTGRRGSVSETKWRMQNSLAYRVFPGNIEEASFAQHRTSGILGQPGAGVIGQPGAGVIGQPGAGVIGQPGAGVIGQPGAGVIGQPGEGVIGQPGNGVIGQPGNGVIGQPGGAITGQPGNGIIGQPGSAVTGQPGNGIIGQPGNGIIGQPGNGIIGQPAAKKDGFLPWSENPQAVFDFYRLKPGMSFNGKSVIALKVHELEKAKGKTKDEWPSDFTVLAEPEALTLLKERSNRFAYEPVGLDVDFVQLLRNRMHADGGQNVKLQTVFGPSAVADDLELSVQPDACEVTVSASEVHVKVKTYARMNRETWELVPDEIEFTLAKSGGLKGQGREFFPVIETKGLRTGDTYYVDLRQFFFTDVSQLMRPMADWSKENAPFDAVRFDMKTQVSMIGFSVRNAASGAEFTYGFLPPSPIKQQ